MKGIARVLPIVVLLPLSGCGWFYGKEGLIRDTEEDYLQATQSAPLKVPATYTAFQPRDQYPVPPLGPKAANSKLGTALDVSPPALVLSSGDGVNGIQDAVIPQALVVGEGDLLWQRLQGFLAANAIATKTVDEAGGEVLTDWVQTEEVGWFTDAMMDEDIEAYRWQYRFKIASGERPNERLISAEAVVAEGDFDGEGWQPIPLNRRYSVDMLNQFLGYFDEAQTMAARQRVMAARAGINVELWQSESGQTGLLAQSGLDNAWDATPAVLARLGFVLEDKDTTKHLYYFSLQEREGGFWDWLFGDDRDEEVLLEWEPGEYLVQLSPVGERTGILFNKADGDPVDPNTLAKILPVLIEVFGEGRPTDMLGQPRR